jgi:hypothetical protein
MAGFKVTVAKARMIASVKKKAGAAATEVQRAVALSAAQVQGTAVRSIQTGGRSGRAYSGRKSGKKRIASAPGEPPKSDTGHLASHIFARVGTRGKNVEAQVGTGVKYGVFWEKFASAKRPWLAPALAKHKDEIFIRIKHAVDRAMRK